MHMDQPSIIEFYCDALFAPTRGLCLWHYAKNSADINICAIGVTWTTPFEAPVYPSRARSRELPYSVDGCLKK